MGNPHNRNFHMRLTEKEHAALHANAKRAGLPLSTYIRMMIKGLRPKKRPPVDWFKYFSKVCSLQQDVNRIAQVLHSHSTIDTQKLDEVLTDMRSMNHNIFKDMYEPEKMDKAEIIRKAIAWEQSGKTVVTYQSES